MNIDLTKLTTGREDSVFKEETLKIIEEKYNAKYLGEFCLKDKFGNWANQATSLFYTPIITNPEYSNYFALFSRNGQTFITNGISATEEPFLAAVADDGEIIYSRYRHDYRTSKDGSVTIDGGRDYPRTISKDGDLSFQNNPAHVTLIEIQIINGEFVHIEPKNQNKPKF